MKKEYAEYLLKKTRDDYNLIAEDFSKTRWNIWDEFNIFKKYIKEGDKIIDVGCGNGRLMELFKGENINYTGVDISDQLINLAREKYPDNNFTIADNLNLPFSDNNFDKVFSIAVLHTIPSNELREKAVAELKRILKPGGLLFITVWDVWRKDTFPKFLKYYFLKLIGKSKLDFKDAFIPWADKTKRYYHFFTKKELVTLTEKADFGTIEKGVAYNKRGTRSNIYLIARKK